MGQTIEVGLRTFLGSQPDITALVGSQMQAKIFPLRMPHDTATPAITYKKISGSRDVSHCGDSSFARPRFQFSCWSDDYLEAKQLAKRLVEALSGYTGQMGDVTVYAVFIDLELDAFDDNTNLYQVLVDATIEHREDNL